MTIEVLKLVMKQGDEKGSALRKLLKYFNIDDNDLSPITDDMAMGWIRKQKCKCWRKGVCIGTREQESCSCNGDITKCDFYSIKELVGQ